MDVITLDDDFFKFEDKVDFPFYNQIPSFTIKDKIVWIVALLVFCISAISALSFRIIGFAR